MTSQQTIPEPSERTSPESGGRIPPQRSEKALVGGLLLAVVTVVLLLAAQPLGLPKEAVGGLVVLLSLVLFLVGIPVGVSMLGASLLGLYSLGGMRVVRSTLESVSFDTTASWSYSVIPMFILMGALLWKSGLTASAFTAARNWLGWMPGGLAVSTNFAGAGLAAGSGSTIGISYALGRVAIPEMLKSGYRPSLAVGVVAAAGSLGQIIPPSLLLVVYAGAAGVAVGPQLLAGVVPGILLAVVFATMIIVRASLNPEFAPREPFGSVSWKQRWSSLFGLIPLVVVVLTVVGGIFMGIFTATEAGVFGALAAFVLGSFNQLFADRGWRSLWPMLRDSIQTALVGTASIFLLLIGVSVLTRVVALSQIANSLAEWIVDFGLGRVGLLLVLVLLYLVLGMFMDTLAMMLLTIPVLMVPLETVGVDPLFFGVFIVVMAEVGLLTPPLGILSFIMHRIASDPEVNLGQNISLGEVFRGTAWFAAAAVAVVIALILFPDVVTWLPNLGADPE